MKIEFGDWFYFGCYKKCNSKRGWYANLQIGSWTLSFHSWLHNVKWKLSRTCGPMINSSVPVIIIYRLWKLSLIRICEKKWEK